MGVDEMEFEKIINDNQAIINKVCFGYTNNLEDRNDLRQEIIIQIWKAYPKFNYQSKISTWIYRIALNTAISNFRRNKRNNVSNELLSAHYKIPEEANNIELEEKIVKLYQLIHRLDDLEKAIMMLYLDDNSYCDIAAIVGITETNVATKINRIKAKLKKQFDNN
jgi:RNA polymerase sigma-70 factor (ECF subfamily)